MSHYTTWIAKVTFTLQPQKNLVYSTDKNKNLKE